MLIIKITVSPSKCFARQYSFYPHNIFMIGASIIPVLQVENWDKKVIPFAQEKK